MPSLINTTQGDAENHYSANETKLSTLHDQFPALLQQFQKDFVTYNVNPVGSNPAQTGFFNDRTYIQNSFNDLFKVIGDIQTDLTVIDASTNTLNAKLQKEKTTYADLSQKVVLYSGKVDTASILQDDYSTIYFTTFVGNITLFIGICLAGAVMFRTFRNSIPSKIKLPSIPSISSVPSAPSK